VIELHGHPRTVRYLVLWLTTACNLRCVYCYRPEESPQAMHRETISKAVALAALSGLPFHVQLAGGEPTLEPELIEYVAQQLHRHTCQTTLAVQTNATLLDKAMVSLFSKYGASVGVSLDGPPHIQERLRGGAGAAFRGLSLLAEAGVPFRVTTVLSEANANHLGDLILCLAVFPNARGFGLDFLVRKGRGEHLAVKPPSATRIGNIAQSLASLLGQVNTRRPAPLAWREHDLVVKAFTADSSGPAFCHAALGQSLAVHPSGRVYPCGQSVGNAAHAAGNIYEVDWEALRNAYRGVRLHGNCNGCPLEDRCPGDCPSRLLANTPEESQCVCALYRALAQTVLKRKQTWSH
jgi:uncharacterized protein